MNKRRRNVKAQFASLQKNRQSKKPSGGAWSGVSELRLKFGSGYRVYFAQEGDTFILLLCGGDKDSQDKDIKTAKTYWVDYRRRSHGKNK